MTSIISHWWNWIVLASGAVIVFYMSFAKVRQAAGMVFQILRTVFGWPLDILAAFRGLEQSILKLGGKFDILGDKLNEVHDLAIIGNAKADLTLDDAMARFQSSPTGECIWTNRSLQSLFGLSEDRMIGYGWTSVIHPDDSASAVDRWKTTVKNWVPYRARYRILVPGTSESYREVEATAEPILDGNRRMLRLVGKVSLLDGRKPPIPSTCVDAEHSKEEGRTRAHHGPSRAA